MAINNPALPEIGAALFSIASVRRHWRSALAAGGGVAVIALLVTYLLQPVYLARAVLLPVKPEESGGLFQIPSAFGEFASLAGVSTGTGDTVEALETLRSRSLAEQFIKEHGLLDEVAAGGLLGRLLGRGEHDEAARLARAVRRFRDNVVHVSEDRRTGVVQLSVFWIDPEVAALWANELTQLVNRKIRARTIAESKRRLEYLNREAAATDVVGVRDAIYRVIEVEFKSMMLANSREDFAFRVIDPATAAAPDDYVRPNRLAFIVGGFLLGAIAAMVVRQRRSTPA